MAAPTVTGISPTEGDHKGGTAVTITGTVLTGASAVNFGANPATTVVVVSATQITCVSPPGTLDAQVDVEVTTSGGTSAASSADVFTYVETAADLSADELAAAEAEETAVQSTNVVPVQANPAMLNPLDKPDAFVDGS